MRLLILSDIHGNWPALEAVLTAEPTRDAVAFCGDAVDYGSHPVECLRWLMQHADHVVRGNHDNALGYDLDCRCMGTFREFSQATRSWHRTLLGAQEMDFLRALPTRRQFELRGTRFRLAHATPEGDMFEYLERSQWNSRLGGIDEDFVLLGHTHVQGQQTFGRITVVNPGSVGLARDHRGKACYAVYEDGRMELKRLAYDVRRTAAALRAAPLPASVIEGLVRVLGPDDRGCPS